MPILISHGKCWFYYASIDYIIDFPVGYLLQTSITHWGRVMYICITKPNTICLDNGLSPGRHQAIILTNAGIFLIGPLGTNFNEILLEIYPFSFKKIH